MKKDRIGPKIKEIRTSRNLNQRQFADSLGYTNKSMITHIEKGDSDMTYEKILRLIRVYELDANDLFEVEHIDKLIKENEIDKRRDRSVVVYIHGLHGSASEINDYSYLSKEYDLSGLDYKDSNPWELENFIKDEFEKLTKNYKEVIVIANSIGAFYAYSYLSNFNIKKAFFISPIVNMFKIINDLKEENKISDDELIEKKFITLKSGETLSYDFYKKTKNFKDKWKVPTKILYGENDNLVDIKDITSFLANHPNSELTIKKNGEHYMHTEEDLKFIKKWILNNI